MKTILVVACLCLALPCAAQDVDARLMTYINGIRAIDNHSHVVAPDLAHDKGYDALPCEIFPASTSLPPANVRFGPDLQGAWKALWGFTGSSDGPEQLEAWQARQNTVRERRGTAYFDWVLQQSGIDIVLANRVTMAGELGATHFRWVPYDDALLFPLDNTREKARTPDRRAVYTAAEQQLETYMTTLGVNAMPATLDQYLDRIVEPTLSAQKSGGAVAIKFEVAYLRTLDFETVTKEIASPVYAKYASGGVPTDIEYKQLQDFLFHDIAARAGRLKLVIHIHTGTGCGEYFSTRGADPLLLESVLNDTALKSTSFVLLHGGSPLERRNISLIGKSNAWVDTSVLELLFSAPELARILRPWLETMPEHVLFGSDAGPFGPGLGWEETTWIASRKARRALGIVLTQMLRERLITRARAQTLARLVLRDNAAALYGFK